jgi:hypothetical protein
VSVTNIEPSSPAPAPVRNVRGSVSVGGRQVVPLEHFDRRLVRETPNGATPIRSGFLAVTGGLLPSQALHCVPDDVRAATTLAWLAAAVLLSLLLRHLSQRPPACSRVDARIDERGIYIDGRLALRQQDIQSGATHAAVNGEIRVVFRRRHTLAGLEPRPTPLVFFAADCAEAEAMLAAAGVDPRRRAFRAVFLRSYDGLPLLLSLALTAWLLVVSGELFWTTDRALATRGAAILAGVLASATGIFVAPMTVTVGTDGVAISRAFRTRFVRFDEIRDVHIGVEVRLVLTSGAVMPLGYARPSEAIGRLYSRDLALEHAALRDRVVDGIRDYWRHEPCASHVSVLDRGSRSLDDWFASLMAVAIGTNDYRTTPMLPEDLLRIVRDPRAAGDARVAAAVALRVGAGDVAEQIRLVAESTASPTQRAFLMRIANTNDRSELLRLLSLSSMASARR